MDKPKFQIVDLGVHRPDYFNGFGSSFTPFDHSTYGVGDTAEDAYQDALESAAQFSPWAEIDLKAMPERCPFGGTCPDQSDEGFGDRAWYHVGIRWNTIRE